MGSYTVTANSTGNSTVKVSGGTILSSFSSRHCISAKYVTVEGGFIQATGNGSYGIYVPFGSENGRGEISAIGHTINEAYAVRADNASTTITMSGGFVFAVNQSDLTKVFFINGGTFAGPTGNGIVAA